MKKCKWNLKKNGAKLPFDFHKTKANLKQKGS